MSKFPSLRPSAVRYSSIDILPLLLSAFCLLPAPFFPLLAESPPPPIVLPDSLRALTNLCLRASAPTFSGSLGPAMTPSVAAGREPPLRDIHIPPQDLVIRWPTPVTLAANAIAWESPDVYGLHVGLEYWDTAQKRYVLLYEEPHNQTNLTVRHFPPVTTTEIRFTIFDHILRYDSIVIRQFALFGTPTPHP